MSILEGKRILLGVSGSIAAYKAAEIASRLTQEGAQVITVLSPAAEKFITPLTFRSLTDQPAYTDADLWGSEGHILHVGLGRESELMLIAPCSANTLAALAHGSAEHLLTLTALTLKCPLAVAPAMDGGMFEHAATQQNVQTLRERGIFVLGPTFGRLASGQVGLGRMLEPLEIVGHVRRILGLKGPLAGRKVVVTSGGTQEPIDPVRVLTNRSSGKQGYALAQAAIDLGADTVLISTPTALMPPVGARLVNVQTAEEMRRAVLQEVQDADVLLMAAAVADFRPRHTAAQKIKKQAGLTRLELEPTADILAEVAAQRQRIRRPFLTVGFAAESQELLENATQKLQSKDLDLIAANDITAQDAGFGVDTNRVTLIYRNGTREALPLMSKMQVAEAILSRIVGLLMAP
ncbi:MAG: bifunctional phosphopantothenoylcysteine decarboxylase/phosphopantothenate--cysteine ligase CoaBC [Anaerolineales bacterium]